MSTTTTISKLLAVFLYATFHAIAALIDIFIDATIWLTTGLTEGVEWLYNSNNRRVIGELINVYLDTCFRLDSGLAIVAWINSNPGSHHLDKTKIIPISYLHSFVSNSSDKNRIIFVRGLVRSNSPLVFSHCSQERTKGVALQKTEIFNGIQGQISGLRPKPSLERVPFVVALEGDSDIYLNVKFKDSTHPVPFTTVYHYSQRTTYKFLGREYHEDKVIEEKMLQLDKEITAVGSICISEDGVLEISPCKDLPYFLSDQTRKEADNIWLQKLATICVGMLLVFTSFQILKFAFTNILWQRKEWWQDRQVGHQAEAWRQEGRTPRDEVGFWFKNGLALAIASGLIISVHLLKHSKIWRDNVIAPIDSWWQYLKKLMRQERNYFTDKVRKWHSQCMERAMQTRNYVVGQLREPLPYYKRWAMQGRDYIIERMRQLMNNTLALLQRWLQERPVDQHRGNVRRVQAGNVSQAFGRQADHVAGVGTDEGLPEERLCVICLENRKAIAFFTCGHVVCCTTCASSVRQTLYPRCPLCRRFISYSLPVYL